MRLAAGLRPDPLGELERSPGPLAGSDPDAVWDGRSDGSRNEAGSWLWGSVNGKKYFFRRRGGWANLGRAIVTNGEFASYRCESA